LRAENEALKQIALERDKELESVQAHAQGLLKILKKVKAPIMLQGNEFMVQACIEGYVNGRDEKLPTLALQPPEEWASDKPNKEMRLRAARGEDALISPQKRRLDIDAEVTKLLPSKQTQNLL
jgi:hypothetical protein